MDTYTDNLNGYPTWKSNETGVTARQLFEKAVYSFEDLVSEIRVIIRGDQRQHWWMSKSLGISLDPKNCTVTLQVSSIHGRCYTIESTNKDLDIERILIAG